MIDIRRVLCPVDFSEHADVAADWARDLSDRFGAELHLLHVVAVLDPLIPPGAATFASELVREIQESARSRLDEVAGGHDAVTALREGAPFGEIVDYATEQDIDLIVMGTHGRTGISHLLIGSVAEKVVRRAPCAVLTIRSDGQQFEAT